MSTWLITGCSTGLGRALAEAIIAAGHNAVVTARDIRRSPTSPSTSQTGPRAVRSTSPTTAQVANAVQQAEEKFGGIDVLVNNAGYGYRAAVEEGDDSDIARLFETQFFGAVAMIKAVLPGMRAAAQARSSTSPRSASDHARRAPATTRRPRPRSKRCRRALRGELEPLGISVTVVEPGAFRTDFAGRSLTQSAASSTTTPTPPGKRRKEHDTAHGTQAGDPTRAARRSSPRSNPTSARVPTAGQRRPQHLPQTQRRQTRHHRNVGGTSPQAPTSTPDPKRRRRRHE